MINVPFEKTSLKLQDEVLVYAYESVYWSIIGCTKSFVIIAVQVILINYVHHYIIFLIYYVKNLYNRAPYFMCCP